ncbi:MAG: anhydro-N-acetylmuramic acid kinase [Saprospiraceae bacterium]|nr:anhydro-N-acetylmuramic acid kinase [Saprospiraceae bacterium]
MEVKGLHWLPWLISCFWNNLIFYLNLGGISNIAFTDRDGRLRSFDVCPCNQILNRLANQIDMEYDTEGQVAASGSLIPSLLTELNDFEFYKQSPPKSLDNNWVMGKVWPVIENAEGSIADKLATFSHHIAWQIAQSYCIIISCTNTQPLW